MLTLMAATLTPVLATTPILEDLVKEATCGAVEVESVVPRGVDPHSFVLSPKAVKAINGAGALVSHGARMEHWLKPGMVKKSTVKLELAAELSLHKKGTRFDPHFWHSPQFVKEAGRKIATFVAALPGVDKAKIEACGSVFEKRVNDAEASVRATLASVPAERRVIALTHDSMGYFAEAFSFRVEALMGLNTEASPTPQNVKRLVKVVKDKKIAAVFVETGTQRKLMEAVAREAGVKVGGELVADALGEKGTPAGTVLGMWQQNAKVIADALK